MTVAGTIAVAAIGLALLVWVVALIRSDKLYVGYGVIFVFGTLAALTIVVIPPLLAVATDVSTELLPQPALGALAIVILTFLMVYVFTQISVLSNRVTRLTQELALRNAQQPGTESDGRAH